MLELSDLRQQVIIIHGQVVAADLLERVMKDTVMTAIQVLLQVNRMEKVETVLLALQP